LENEIRHGVYEEREEQEKMHMIDESDARQAMQVMLSKIWKDKPCTERVTAELLIDLFTEELRKKVTGKVRARVPVGKPLLRKHT
jgi:hypothetical protein